MSAMTVGENLGMTTSGVPQLKERLSFLTATVPPPTGMAAWTSEVIAEQVRSLGVEVNAQHVSHLRAGRRDNPSAVLLAAIADVFGVPVDYFFDAERAERIERQLASLSRMKSAGVQGLAARGALGDVEVIAQVLDALELIRRGGDGGRPESDSAG